MQNKKQPLEYNYIHTQFKGIPFEERVELKFNPHLEKRKEEIIQAKKLANTGINLLRSENNTVKNIEKAIKRYLFGENETQTKVVNSSTGLNAIINSRSIHEMINEANNVENKHQNKVGFRAELYNIIANSKELFTSAEYILSYNEIKQIDLKNKQKLHKYANVVATANNCYILIYTIKENNQRNTVIIYDLEEFEQNKSSGDLVRPNGATPSRTNTSIAQLREFVHSKIVEKYNNDYKNLQKGNK